jgi:hypothetical protein
MSFAMTHPTLDDFLPLAHEASDEPRRIAAHKRRRGAEN